MLVKSYGQVEGVEGSRRYSLPVRTGTQKERIMEAGRGVGVEFLRRGGEPVDADADAGVYPADQCLQ